MEVGVAVILNSSKQVLAVSRKDDHNNLTLPGGKREEPEDMWECVVREVFEQTGLKISRRPQLIDVRKGLGADVFVWCFFAKVDNTILNTSENHIVKWMNPKDFVFQGSNFSYNLDIFETYFNGILSRSGSSVDID